MVNRNPDKYRFITTFLNRVKTRLFKLLNSQPDNQRHKALSVTFGVYLGLFPVIGATTLLCLLLSFIFRLNHFLVQGVNLLLAPVHLALILPMLKAGRWLFFGDGHVISAISFQNGITFKTFMPVFESVAGGIIIWMILSFVTAPVFYFFLLKLLGNNVTEIASDL